MCEPRANAPSLPATTWARVLRFVGEPGPAATARAVREAVPLCLVELMAHRGVAAYCGSAAPAASLADAFAAALLFARDEALGGHFAARRPVMAEYLRAAAPARPSLAGLAAWLFERPELDPLTRRGKGVPRMLSFGLVRVPGWQPSWALSGATMAPAAKDLLRALQGIARALLPGRPYLWMHISRARTPRRKFKLPTESFVVSLPAGRCYRMAAGAVAGPEQCELETMVSWTVPLAPYELPAHREAVSKLEDIGFVVPS
eukprot:g4947.t1